MQALTEPVRAPGLAALLRRHPRAVRRTSVGAIATGTVLFVLASVLTPGASARTEHQPAALGAPQPQHVPLAAPSTSASGSPSPTIAAARGATPARRHTAARPARDLSVSTLAANGIPTVALNAYRVAAARMASADPSCGIDWSLLAGIGRVESDHGRFGGAVLHADGTSTPKIIGPALNGHGTARIPAPPNGAALDGDPVYTHALGPMQFIPQTWAGYGADADGDGVANIFDINDAALGAARYLCAAGGNLRTHAGQVRAVMAYNHVSWYVTEVLALADAYRRGVPISGIPIGQLTGKLPPVKRTGTPADPGPPAGVGDGSGRSGRSGSGSGSSRGSGASGSSHPTSSPTSGRTSPTQSPSSSPSSSPSGSRSSSPSGSPTSSSPSGSPTSTCSLPLDGTCLLP